ncbi:hypothetical protein BU24DRAFT_427420 [Aaosphaeria arxii CBS 175.79]|uniref:Uncharacterized protein n=1 Tax=Aaosphaeria arxii CBS 175.79 TaxID=1450172 RepID=A0A6A5XBE4_9PLEO|nr:uncharacterized protein BU24DRAFT_427420 [Aaosphaeria arxii CBS 175.79]KAF2010292.1 hypothetical protein BU24DRAFT_427420 [Aaosphaeria arxii CBS 175.79]
MVQVRTYTIPPTKLMPNSPHLLIHYPKLLLSEVSAKDFNPTTIYDLFASNGWQSQWIARYGRTQLSHYHSAAHECMAVISGNGATLRFGVADTTSDEEEHTHGHGYEDGAIEVQASLGDVFILPAGVAHKTYAPRPDAETLKFHESKEDDGTLIKDTRKARKFFEGIAIEGEFMMMGAYPVGNEWDFRVGGDHEGRYREVWRVPKPKRDPVLGQSKDGLVGIWKESPNTNSSSKL